MRISEGGLGAPLERVLGDVLKDLAKAGEPLTVTIGELVERVHKTDRFTGLSHYGDQLRHLTPVGPTAASIRRVLKKKVQEGVISIEHRAGPFGPRITLLKPWDTSGDWSDGHDPTQCHCGGDYHGRCWLHDGEEAFRLAHAECAEAFPCHHGLDRQTLDTRRAEADAKARQARAEFKAKLDAAAKRGAC